MAKTTRADEIELTLRAEILGGRMTPGAQLKFQPLVDRLGVSIAVLREAFSRLVDSGLVEVVAHQGYRVKTLSYTELADLTAARVQVEVAVLVDSVSHGTLQWESEVVAAHHILEQTPLLDSADPRRMSDEWASAHESFHSALLSSGTNRRMAAFAARLREEAELYRRWSIAGNPPGERDISAEHRQLLELAISRRAKEAGVSLANHISRTTELVLETVSAPAIR